jgi:hypothetical protein
MKIAVGVVTLWSWLLSSLSSLVVVHAIYPDDHWDYSEQLTTDNFESFLTTHVEAGKTVLVRWIASSG